ncbi:hypothetical protein [Breoghania sp. JC706]|uniref:hypothetical protein n=1 Tax=Breoghania sp. JC706 TaxID=3117732 RepID=UPI00300BB95C
MDVDRLLARLRNALALFLLVYFIAKQVLYPEITIEEFVIIKIILEMPFNAPPSDKK